MRPGVNTFVLVLFVLGALAVSVVAHLGDNSPAVAQTQTQTEQQKPKVPWLTGTIEERLAQIERHLRGLDVSMAEIGYRYDELLMASKYRNWDYAKYQTEKIELSLRLALERRPKRVKSATPFLEESIPPVLNAIQNRNSEQLDLAIGQLRSGCIECHRAENVLYMGQEFAIVQPTPEAIAKSIRDARQMLTPEYLAGADRSQGRLVFSEHCANCHRFFGEGSDIGPDLTGLQRSNLDYLITRMIDPNSLIGMDYQMGIVLMEDGRMITGLVTQEDEKNVTFQTGTEVVEEVIVPKADIEERSVSKVSMMPEKLLEKFSKEQMRDLFGYLQGNKQVLLPTEKN